MCRPLKTISSTPTLCLGSLAFPYVISLHVLAGSFRLQHLTDPILDEQIQKAWSLLSNLRQLPLPFVQRVTIVCSLFYPNAAYGAQLPHHEDV